LFIVGRHLCRQIDGINARPTGIDIMNFSRVKSEKEVRVMIDNTSSTVDAGSLPLQRDAQSRASAVNDVKVANVSELAKTEVTAPQKVINHVSKAKENSESSQATPKEETSELTPEAVAQVVDKLNAFVQLTKRDISFGIDEQSGRDVISVFEAETQELIRQIPSEEALALLKRMDQAIGLLFSEGVIKCYADIESIRPDSDSHEDSTQSNNWHVQLKHGVQPTLTSIERFQTTYCSCGLCGATSLKALELKNPPNL